MTVQDHVDNFIKNNPGVSWSMILKYCVEIFKDNPGTVKGAIKRFKKKHPTLYHPGQTQTEWNLANADLLAKIAEEDALIFIAPRPLPGIQFQKFVEDFAYPRYGGLFEFQMEIFRMTWQSKWSMINLPRDHGKSIYLAFLCEWAMEDGWDILYLGWTDRRKEIAEFVYAYFVLQNQIASRKIKQSTSGHFQINNGCKFDTYLVTAKEVLGMHAMGKTLDQIERKLLIIIDDPIDETFREERHKEYKLENKWKSTISNINPNKIMFVGTKKFEEDFFYFIKRTYTKKHGLVHYYRRSHLCTPNIEHLSMFYGDLTHKYKFSELPAEEQNLMLDKAKLDPCYNPDLKYPDLRFIPGLPPEKNLLCPERWTQSDLNLKREEVGEYWWHSEYEQNPHPITGEVWESLQYIPTIDAWQAYDMGMIIIDAATAEEAKKAGTPMEKKLQAVHYTGIVVVLRHMPTKEKHVIFDLTGEYNFQAKMKIIEEYYRMLRHKNINMKVKVVIEKQGGGDDIVSAAQASRKYSFGAHIIDIHQKRDKIMRIDDYLRVPINKGKVKFVFNLRYSELVNEILNFPYPEKLDAIDALATGIHEFENHEIGLTKEEIRTLIDTIRQRKIQRYESDWTRKNLTPWVKQTSARSRIRRTRGG